MIRHKQLSFSFLRNFSLHTGFQPQIKVWNSLKNQLVPLGSKTPGIFTWYACGPTVYDSAHIGHASSYIRQDVIRRILEGLDSRICVLQLMGVTDIDDKIIKKANELNVPWASLSKKYELEFFEDLELLNVKQPQVRSRVSDFIPKIISFVADLVESGNAYPVQDGSIYFDTQRHPSYGKLRKLSENVSVEEGKGKKNSQDFALWKGWKQGEPFWTTPWGRGRPGWHIECSAMASHYFGSSLDIHSGGVDLIFPHHENEEAQCCAKFGVENWVRHWIHTGHLNCKGDTKMSKSLGNTVTIRDFLSEYSAETFRMFCIISKYRNCLEFSSSAMNHANAILQKFQNFLLDTCAILQSSKIVHQTQSLDLWEELLQARGQVYQALIEDFDTPSAINRISEYIDRFNENVASPKPGSTTMTHSPVDFSLILASADMVRFFLSLVGILKETSATVNASAKVDSLLQEFSLFRGQVRNYALAIEEEDKSARKRKIAERQQLLKMCDDARGNLSEMGFNITDHGKLSSVFIK